MSACSVSGTSSDRTVPVGGNAPSSDDQSAVEQHADRLDRVERNALGPLQHLIPHLLREPGNESGEELRHRRVAGERLETEWKLRPPAPQVGRRSMSSGRASVRTKMGKFRDHSRRYSTKSSTGVGPLEVLEDDDERYVSASRSMNRRQPEKRSSWSAAAVPRAREGGRAAARPRARLRRGRAARACAELRPRLSRSSSSRMPALERTISASAQ